MSHWSSHPLLQQRRREFLDAPMHALTMEETLALAEQAMTERRPLHHTVINVAKLVNMRRNAELNEDVSTADIINIDGAGIMLGARMFGIDVPERVAGVDIMTNLFDLCERKGFRPFLLGAEASVLDAVRARLKREHPAMNLAGMQDGYFAAEDEEAIVDRIRNLDADCLFVAMPSPRKERFLRRHRDSLGARFIMGVGGSFDVYGGKVKRAPLLWQRLGMEWAYRIVQEPGRMWRRYLETNTAFAGLLLREGWRKLTGHPTGTRREVKQR